MSCSGSLWSVPKTDSWEDSGSIIFRVAGSDYSGFLFFGVACWSSSSMWPAIFRLWCPFSFTTILLILSRTAQPFSSTLILGLKAALSPSFWCRLIPSLWISIFERSTKMWFTGFIWFKYLVSSLYRRWSCSSFYVLRFPFNALIFLTCLDASSSFFAFLSCNPSKRQMLIASSHRLYLRSTAFVIAISVVLI